ncbi:MAG: hypothetical protein R3F30_09625 [Planctomycetota bacterium]
MTGDQAATLRRRLAGRATVVRSPRRALAALLSRSDPVPGYRAGPAVDAGALLLVTRPDPASLAATLAALARRAGPGPGLCVVDAPTTRRPRSPARA